MKTLRLLMGLCLLLSIRNLGAAWTILANLGLYREVGAAGIWWLYVPISAGWGMIFLWLAWGLRQRQERAYRALLPLYALYVMLSFGWYAIFARATYDRGRIAFVGVTSILGLGLTIWFRTRIRNLFGDGIHDQ